MFLNTTVRVKSALPEFGINILIPANYKTQFSKFGKLMFVHACILIICIKLWQSDPRRPLLFSRKVLFKL